MSGEFDPLAVRTHRRDKIAWTVALLSAAVLTATWFWWKQHQTIVLDVPAAREKTPHIAILSFDRIVPKEDGIHLTQEKLRDCLRALKAAGFNSITPAQLEGFYYQAQALPSKPLLLLFEHGYYESAKLADPVLRELRWHASISLQTHHEEERNTSFLYWDRLQNMVASGAWDVVSEGQQTDRLVDAGGGQTVNFLAGRAWLQDKRRFESEEEFAGRVTQDVVLSKDTIASRLAGYEVRAFSYPVGSVALQTSDRRLEALVFKAIADNFRIGFVDDLFGVNDLTVPPYQLKRLRVTPSFSGKHLVERLNAALQAATAQADKQLWVSGTDLSSNTTTSLVLQSASRAQAWLAGSQWDDNWELNADITFADGELWLVSALDKQEWRFGGQAGALYLQTVENGRVTQTLTRFTPPRAAQPTHHLRFIRRGHGAWIEWNGVPLSKRPLYLPANWHGILGWKVWKEDGKGTATINNFKLSGYPYDVRELSANPSGEEVQRLIDSAPRISAIAFSPEDGKGGSALSSGPSTDLLKILAHRYGFDVLARVSLDKASPGIVTDGALASSNPKQLASGLLKVIEQGGWQGIYLEAPTPERHELASLLPDVARRLAQQNKRMIVAPANPRFL